MTDDKPKPKRRPFTVPEPPPETFIRTPEQRAADKAELDAEIARLKAADASPGDALDPDGEQALQELRRTLEEARATAHAAPVPSAADKLRELGLDRWHSRSLAWQAERRELACWKGLHPAGAPDGFLASPADQGTAIRGRAMCRAAGARAGCKYSHEQPTCLWERADDFREQARSHMDLARVEEEEFKLVLAAVDPDAPVPLKPYDPLQLVRRWLAGGRQEVKVENAAELDPLTGAIAAEGVVRFAGDERLLVFGGNPGRGKTIAGVYAIARDGGLYVLDYALRRPFDEAAAAAAPGVLVVDQIQPRDPDEKKRAALRLDEIVTRRFARGKRTLLIGNIDYLTFARRYGAVEGDRVKHPGVIAERCAQAGLFVLFGGPSLRADVTA